MRTEQGLALIALILGIIGGVLLLSGGVEILRELLEGSTNINPNTLLIASFGVVAIIGSVVIWTGRYVTGGAINIALGVLMVLLGEIQQGLIILVSGILGIVAPKIND